MGGVIGTVLSNLGTLTWPVPAFKQHVQTTGSNRWFEPHFERRLKPTLKAGRCEVPRRVVAFRFAARVVSNQTNRLFSGLSSNHGITRNTHAMRGKRKNKTSTGIVFMKI